MSEAHETQSIYFEAIQTKPEKVRHKLSIEGIFVINETVSAPPFLKNHSIGRHDFKSNAFC